MIYYLRESEKKEKLLCECAWTMSLVLLNVFFFDNNG